METRSDTNGGGARPLPWVLAIVTGLVRLIPVINNFAPLGAVGLFSGAKLRRWHGFVLPVALFAFTDIVLWALRGPDYGLFHPTRAFVYPSILLYAVIGRALASTDSVWRVGLAAVLGSFQFFVITNLGTWLFGLDIFGNAYPQTVEGLLYCYTAAVPFHQYTLLSDLGFTAVLFGAHAWLTRTSLATQPEAAAVPERVS